MNYFKHLNFVILLFAFTFYGCSNSTENKPKEQSLFVIKNVNIIPMTIENNLIENATVVIKNKKILSINETIPNNAKIIDGTGKWLIPGLVDMHVHTNADLNFRENAPTQGATFFMDTQDVMTTYIANGVTTIFELEGRVEHFGQRNEIAKGKVIGPRMAIAALINGGNPNNSGRIVNTASDARQVVRSIKAEGYNFVKVYSKLNIESFETIIDESKKQGLKVVGHIPDAFKGQTEKAFVPNFGLVAHAEEFSKQIRNQTKTKKDAQYFAQLSKENDTWLIPNLIAIVKIRDQVQSLDSIRLMETLKYVHPLLQDKWLTSNNYNKHSSSEFIDYLDSLITFHKGMVVAFKEAGVPMVAGTDAGVSGIVTGFSLHDELELLVDAGLTNEEALFSATRLPAEWLEIENNIGTIEINKYADLILLDANPLEDIKNTRTINGVFVNGTWLDKEQIEKMLSNLEKWNLSNKEKYKWKDRRKY
ncbi:MULTISPECIES: amidohydrolase family protein [Tenacibaculum]|uniref:amidohydrolase family protein n=1 Tax=Tenacibaculum TaxID=104267 RepID=UPI001F0B682F|nr:MULTISPECIES: amidohydrolase family protein [Tenacibaculum]MCH3882039.1 amidohydrolase family protein [Tenacibaculum aquimarinum]MDO6599680.1 amidohydrolase family protein [Tenacibaculum sp. 1_MG-2023]